MITKPMLIVPVSGHRVPGVRVENLYLSLAEEVSADNCRGGLAFLHSADAVPEFGIFSAGRLVGQRRQPIGLPDDTEPIDRARAGLSLLLSSMLVDAEAYRAGTVPDNGWTFTPRVAKWATRGAAALRWAAMRLGHVGN